MNTDLTGDRPAQLRPSDDYFGSIPIKLTKEELGKLSELSQLRSTLHIVAEWTTILTAIYLCQRHFGIVLYLLTVAFIGARQHALLILMHDGVHYRLFRNRRLNDWTAEVVLAWPNLISARAYRKNHFGHHRYLNTLQDPDWARRQGDPTWVFPQHWSRLATLMLRDLSGLGAIYYLRLALMLLRRDTGVSRGFLVARYGFYVVVVAMLAWFGAIHLLLMYWFVPLFTWMTVIFRVRSIAEHSAIEGSTHAYAQTRSTRASLLEHIFVAPKNVNYHIEHHFYPSVPFYRLPELHRVLMSRSDFKQGVHVTSSYLEVLRESVRGAGPVAGRLWEVFRIQPSRAQG
ncbi:MAG TPA: fatty acid desaturase family protein [Patescibacteria group bacterium]|nr:fatty acid desaturase family protein [Patescibacteria group bacterium]